VWSEAQYGLGPEATDSLLHPAAKQKENFPSRQTHQGKLWIYQFCFIDSDRHFIANHATKGHLIAFTA
jgi:hypothetical protein